MKIIGCAYRRWALQIFEHLEKSVEIKIIRSPENITPGVIEEYQPDLILFYGWSWTVPDDIVNNYLCLCLHPSPLPKYRGGSPIQNQIMNGEVESAVSIFKMTEEIDAGDLCAQVPFSLEGNLWEILNTIRDIGSFETLRIIRELKNLKYWPQEGEITTFKRRLPDESEITFEELRFATARYLHNKIRGLQSPYPNAYIICSDGKKLYLTEAQCEE